MKQIRTERVRLVPLCVEHAGEMFPLLSDLRIYEFLQGEPPASLVALQKRYRGYETRRSPDGSQQWLNWIIQLPDDGACIGFIQATIHTRQTGDFAYILGRPWWGRGLAHEAASAALRTLFTDYAVNDLYAMADQRNARSISLLSRLRFQRIEPAEYPHGEVPSSDHAFLLATDVWSDHERERATPLSIP